MGDGSSRFICVYHGGLWYDGEGCDECAVDECFGDLEEREVREMSESRGDELLYEWLQEPPERTPEQPETPTTYAGQVIATALEQVRLDKALRRQPTPAMTWPQTRELVDGYMDRELPLGQPLAYAARAGALQEMLVQALRDPHGLVRRLVDAGAAAGAAGAAGRPPL